MVRVAMIALGGVILSIFLKHKNQEWALLLSLAVCTVLAGCIVVRLGTLLEYVQRLKGYMGAGSEYAVMLLKMVGVSYTADIAAGLCRDSGQQSLASQVELFGRLSVLAIGLPVVLSLVDTFGGMLGI